VVPGICLLSAALFGATSCYAPRRSPVSVEPPAPPAGEVPDADSMLDPSTAVSLPDALRYAWYYHPRMLSARKAMAAASDRMLVAQLWPNPALRANLADEAERKTFYRAEVLQALELGGKRDARVSVAAARAFERQAGAVAAWCDVRAEVKRTHARCVYLEERQVRLTDLQGVATQQHTLASELVSAGKQPADFPARFAVSLAEREAAVAVNKDLVVDALRRFRVALGRPASPGGGPSPTSLAGGPVALPDYEALHGMVIDASPDLASARAAVRLAHARLLSARAARWADPRIGAHVKRFEYDADDETSEEFGLALEVELHLRNLSKADTRAAENDLAASQDDARAAALSVAAELSRILADARRLETELGTLKRVALPQAENTLVLAEARYRQGKTDAFARLKARQELLLVRLGMLDKEWQSTVARIELERLGAVLRPLD